MSYDWPEAFADMERLHEEGDWQVMMAKRWLIITSSVCAAHIALVIARLVMAWPFWVILISTGASLGIYFVSWRLGKRRKRRWDAFMADLHQHGPWLRETGE